jgi:hypothetical protein
MYLGDGYLAPTARGSRQLRIYLDNVYPSIILECARAIEQLFPGRRAGLHHHATYNMVLVTLYSRYWEALLPQRGPGMKHTRTIRLTEWQRELVKQEPGRFARGLIHSDGWRGVNRVRSPAGKQYVYPRYEFSNRSEDILGLFGWACDLLGVSWRRMNHKSNLRRPPRLSRDPRRVHRPQALRPGVRYFVAEAGCIRERVSSSAVAKNPPTTSSSWPIDSAQ